MSAVPPPQVMPYIFDETFDQETGLQPIPVRHAFSGNNLRLSVNGGNAHYDPTSGCVLVPTARAHDGSTLTVKAMNQTGACTLDINVIVEADDDLVTLASANADLAHTQTRSEIEADGVTFRFERAAPTGRFITGADGQGDPFVVGPVTLLGYTPAPIERSGRAMNGAMLNPICGRKSGFDSMARAGTYSANLNDGLKLPLKLMPGDSLIVAVSNPHAKKMKQVTQRFVVLTCLADIPFADSFRPAYSGPERPIWRLSDINPDALASLPISPHSDMPNQAELETRFQRFAIEIASNWNRDHLHAQGHSPTYGRDLCQQEADPYVWVNLDLPYARKEKILAGLIQRGIDRYGAFRSARVAGHQVWQPNGGHNSGRKFSILFAGHVLDDPAMSSVMAQMRGADGAEPGWFQEDGMSFYVTQETVDITNSDAWKPPYHDDPKRPKQPYSTNMIGMPDWRGKASDIRANAAWTGHPYRIAGNANTQHGQVLAALAMGLRDLWGHDAYFDYHMRYMEIMASRPDPFQFRGKKQALYNPVTGSRKRGLWDGWTQHWNQKWAWDMLKRHRSSYYRFPWQG